MAFRSEAIAAQPRVDTGSLVWNAEVAGKCITAIDTASCPEILMGVLAQPLSRGPDSLCSARLAGTLVEDAPCGADLDCASGYCSDPGSMRTCAQLPGVGEPCTSRCAEGLGCDVRAATPTCVVRRADGEACTPWFGDVCESPNCNPPGNCGEGPPIVRCTGMR